MDFFRELIKEKTNFIFIGGAGSGKSEIAINFANYLTKLKNKDCHFFDMDMTKPLFRSRDIKAEIKDMGINFHYEEQFFDAPTIVGGVNRLLKDDSAYLVMDVGGDDIGARSIGGFAPLINNEKTLVFYVLNPYRPFSYNIEEIDRTLGEILGISHINLDQIIYISNPNMGYLTNSKEVIEGNEEIVKILLPYAKIDFLCVREEISEEVREKVEMPIFPIKLYLTYEWL